MDWTKDKLANDLDLNGFDPNAPDSDDEPLSDLEMWEGSQNIATLQTFFLKLRKGFPFMYFARTFIDGVTSGWKYVRFLAFRLTDFVTPMNFSGKD